MKWLAGLLALVLWTAAPASDQQDLEQAAAHFLGSFENLDMPAFIACFAEDATAFFPAPEPPERVAGKAAIRNRFQSVFDAIRTGASSGPPYHRLEPQDLQVQMLGTDAAVVTFHLRNSDRLARRTLVMKKVQGAWLIAHLHASTFVRQSATR